MYTKQDETHNPSPAKKTSEPTQKNTSSAAAPTRLPAWTNAWGDQPPAALISSVAELQAKHILSQPADPYEQQADQIADQVMDMAAFSPSILAAPPDATEASPLVAASLSHVPPIIQRAPLDDSTASTPTPTESTPTPATTTPEAAPTSATPPPEAAPETSSPALIVDDSAEQLAPGQMKKSDFLAQLRPAVCTTAEEALKGTIWSAAGCPWIDHWFAYYSSRDSQQIERALRRYAPETARVNSASDYIPIICERVRRGIGEWSTTGEVPSLPEGMELPGMGIMGLAGSVASGIASVGSSIASGVESVASGIASVGSSIASGVGSVLSDVGSLFSKGREGGAREASNPQAIQGQLGAGRSLDGGMRSQMEPAFGTDFSHVRIHTDATAAGLSESLNARAFTVGRDVAFGPGEYRPGTLIGDALIAHELAHVVQQGSVSPSSEPLRKGGTEYNALEEDADVSAVGAVVSMWSGIKGGLANVAQNAMPSMRSGLRLQRCAGTQKRSTTIAGREQIPGWEDKVKAAADASAQANLIGQALGKDIQVRVAGTSDKELENPDDYQPFPVVNFDIDLNSKRAWSNSRRKRDKGTKSLGLNYGHSFRGKGSTKYLVLGPKALDQRSPDYTRKAYEHELYHVQHHLEGSGDTETENANKELETYTQDFINYFHLLRRIGESWKQPILYYEKADPDPQKAALDRLESYYKKPHAQNPLVPQDQVETVKDLFAKWLQDRLNDMPEKQLVQKLDKDLGEDTRKRLSDWEKRRQSKPVPGTP